MLAVGPAWAADEPASTAPAATTTAPAGVATSDVAGAAREYYTSDDGRTYFADKPRATPFMRAGQSVVQAVVCFDPADKQRRWVGYLERVKPEFHAAYDEAIKSGGHLNPQWFEVKRPGDAGWIALCDADGKTTAGAEAVTSVRLPNGAPASRLNDSGP
jgi:hypothetical protein